MSIYNYLRSLFWVARLKCGGAIVGRGLMVCGPVSILLRDGASLKNIKIGDNVTLGGRTYIRMRKNGKVVLEDGARTGTETWLVTANESTLKIGKMSDLGSYCILNAGYGIEIGGDCLFGAFITINSSSHKSVKDELIRTQGYDGGKVTIGDDVWVGSNVNVNKSVTIGNGSVIGAGSVVTKSIGEYKVAYGVPAVVAKDRV